MTNPDTRPTVPLIEGHYGITNFGTVYRLERPGNLPEELGRVFTDDYEEWSWDENGKCTVGGPSPLHDIIATISPEEMQAVASGELQSLRDRLSTAEERLFAVLHRDDGQDYKDGRRYLKAYRPDLYDMLENATPQESDAYTIRKEDMQP